VGDAVLRTRLSRLIRTLPPELVVGSLVGPLVGDVFLPSRLSRLIMTLPAPGPPLVGALVGPRTPPSLSKLIRALLCVRPGVADVGKV
jgi:hypothetical protein